VGKLKNHFFVILFFKNNNKGKSGCIDQAKQIFENLSQPNKFGYTAMSLFLIIFLLKIFILLIIVNSYGLNGMGNQAIELFRQIPLQLIDEVTYICVLNGCSHSGLVDEARSIFKNIKKKTENIYVTMVSHIYFSYSGEEVRTGSGRKTPEMAGT
jgi:pentatricopeptide repeat protein